jgi:hypothetical protein
MQKTGFINACCNSIVTLLVRYPTHHTISARADPHRRLLSQQSRSGADAAADQATRGFNAVTLDGLPETIPLMKSAQRSKAIRFSDRCSDLS